MSRNDINKNAEARRKAVLKMLPRTESKAIGARQIADSLGENIAAVRRDLNAGWADGSVAYSGETRGRVYWRSVKKAS